MFDKGSPMRAARVRRRARMQKMIDEEEEYEMEIALDEEKLQWRENRRERLHDRLVHFLKYPGCLGKYKFDDEDPDLCRARLRC